MHLHIYVNCGFKSSNFVCVVLCFQYELNPQEILKKINGFYGAHQSWVIIKSLTFHTNQAKIGPYGPEQGTYFQTNKEEGKITGIHGFGSRAFVNSIGVYMLKLRTFKPGGRVD